MTGEFKKFYLQSSSPPKFEWIQGWLAITANLDIYNNTKLRLAGNANLLKLLGFNIDQLVTVKLDQQ